MQYPPEVPTLDAIQLAHLQLLDNLLFHTLINGTLVDLQRAIHDRIGNYQTQADAMNGLLYANKAHGETLLYVAVTAPKCNERFNKIDWLIAQGARIDVANQKQQLDDELNCTPLLGAAFSGRLESLQHLIEKHCQSNEIKNFASRLLFATVCGRHTPITLRKNLMEYLIQKFKISPWTLVHFDKGPIEPLIVKISLFNAKENIPLKIFLEVLSKLNIPIDLHHEVGIRSITGNNFTYTLPVLAVVLERGTAAVAKYLITEKNLDIERMLGHSSIRPIDFFYERVKEFSSKDFTNDLSELVLILEFIPLLLDSPVFLRMAGTVNLSKRSLLGYLLGYVRDILFSQPNFSDHPNFIEYFDSYLQCLKAIIARVHPSIQWTQPVGEVNVTYAYLKSPYQSLNKTRAEFRAIIKLDPTNQTAYCIQGNDTNHFITIDAQKFNFESQTIQHILLQKAQAARSYWTVDSERNEDKSYFEIRPQWH